jgi:hypothetical protein
MAGCDRDRKVLAAPVDRAIAALAEPLSREDRSEGWTERTQQRLLGQFQELRTALLDPAPLVERAAMPYLATRPSIGRDLSDEAIEGGRLLDIVCDAHNRVLYLDPRQRR